MWSPRYSLLFTWTQPYIHEGTPCNQLMRNYQEFWLDCWSKRHHKGAEAGISSRWTDCKRVGLLQTAGVARKMTTGEGDLPEFWVIWQRNRARVGGWEAQNPKREQLWVSHVMREEKCEAAGSLGRRWAGGQREATHCVTKKWGHAAMWGLNALPFIKRSLLKIAAPHENLFQALDFATRKGGPQGDLSTRNLLSVAGKSHSAIYLWPIQVNEKWNLELQELRSRGRADCNHFWVPAIRS